MAEHNTTGKKGEEFARKYLIDKNYKILNINWRVYNFEIDIVAQDDDVLVFVEVKTRSSEQWGHPSDAITKSKQRFLINAAHEYIMQHEIDNDARFDVISVITDGENLKIEHIENAFYPEL
jgi:putative endonuclease